VNPPSEGHALVADPLMTTGYIGDRHESVCHRSTDGDTTT
jgi:hypothetical protein